jgi:hypothetical protein
VERLSRYRRRALFPKNQRFPGRALPHFIDDLGTRCAMGHLIESSGERELVQRIAEERNYARLPELTDIPELVVWLEANGLTLDEAARIQPQYCGPASQNCLCGDLFTGYVEGTTGDSGMALTVTATYGAVSGVMPGDTLDLIDTRGLGTSFEVVFASLGGDGRTAYLDFGSTNGEVIIPLTNCWFPQVASIPGPLPLSLVREALSSDGSAACQRVLSDFDEAWGVDQGGCGPRGEGTGGNQGKTAGMGRSGSGASQVSEDAGEPGMRSRDDGGCAMSGHPAGSHALALALSAACVLHGVRRARSRPAVERPSALR